MAIGMKEDDTILEEKRVVSSLGDDIDSPRNNKNNIIIIIAVAFLVIVIIAMLKSINKPEDGATMSVDSAGNTSAQVLTTENNNDVGTSTEVPTVITTEMAIGLPEFDPKENGVTTATVYSASDYIKDLNGYDIPAVYEVANRTYVRDFVNYEAKRAIIADGMEMYWLEVVYKNKPYRCQVPFYIFKDLETTGICVVELEVLTLEGGEQIISFMQVVTNYDDLINE